MKRHDELRIADTHVVHACARPTPLQASQRDARLVCTACVVSLTIMSWCNHPAALLTGGLVTFVGAAIRAAAGTGFAGTAAGFGFATGAMGFFLAGGGGGEGASRSTGLLGSGSGLSW